jgi:snRNA-activating protein complex subunit 3
MDHIYPTKDYREYQIRENKERLQDRIKSSGMVSSFQDIARVLKIDEEKLKTKSLELCKLYEDYGTEMQKSNVEEPFDVFSEETLELNCLKYLRKGDLNFKDDRSKELRACENLVNPAANEEDKDIEIHSDCVITVRFYEPFKYSPSMKNQPRFHQEYQVLGSNFLSELRDKFYCQCNFGPFFDVSNNPKVNITKHPEQPDPGFFYIHDTFYNDTRNEANPDYSDVIIKWFKKFHYVRKFKKGVMHETKFEDLQIRIGYPCVYQHHGACEHIFCITGVDLIDNSDSLVSSHYPKLSYVSKRRAILCDICGQTDATFLITNCALHVKDPTRMCERCFLSFHYVDEELKTCEFQAYRIYCVNPQSEIVLEKNCQRVDEEIENE